MIVAAMLQDGNTNGMTGITADSSDTFYNRNKGQSMQGKIKKITIIDAILLVVLCVAYLILNLIYSGGLA
jgi:protein translocase SecG subunit